MALLGDDVVALIFGSGSNVRGAHAKCSTINGRSIGDALDLEHWHRCMLCDCGMRWEASRAAHQSG
jgi:hypothetical protein